MSSAEGYVTADDGTRLFYQSMGSGSPAILISNGIPLMDDFVGPLGGHTLVFYDLRNRGRSDSVGDRAILGRGIQNDVDDLDAVRRHFGEDRVVVIGHSYVAVTAALYARRHPERVDRFVQIGPPSPDPAPAYPERLVYSDQTTRDVMAALTGLEVERASLPPEEFCGRFWHALRPLYVTDPRDADRIRWGRCDLPNERGFRRYWIDHLVPSVRALELNADVLRGITVPGLVIHGARDRSAPYGGGRDWALRLGQARLLTVDNGGHAPWIEAPRLFFESLAAFVGGRWPATAERVVEL